MPLKIPYPNPPEWPESDEDTQFSPTLGEYLILDPLAPSGPSPTPKGRQAQDDTLRQFGFDPDQVKRPPIDTPIKMNRQGFLMPDEEADLYNERR